MFELIKPKSNIDFMGKKSLWLALSVVVVFFTFILFFTKGLNYGIDFTGGAELQVKVPCAISSLRDILEQGGLSATRVQQIGEEANNQFLIKVQGDEASLNKIAVDVHNLFEKNFQPHTFELQRIDVVGPAAGFSLRMNGFLSMLFALIAILIYVTLRFDYRYSPGAILALFHDTVVTLGVLILTQKQFDLQILAALLALIGYSNNDTIIVFDRVRETIRANPTLSIRAAVNKAINETLGRTILTSLCTFISVFALWLFGGKVIEDFAFTLMVGIIVGAYSSIFIAGSLVVWVTEYQRKHLKVVHR